MTMSGKEHTFTFHEHVYGPLIITYRHSCLNERKKKEKLWLTTLRAL